MKRIYSFEGNIGSGKSTLITLLEKERKLCSYFLNNIVYLHEPVDVWSTIKGVDGTTILEKFYHDQEKYAFSFQMMAYVSRIAQLRNAVKKNPYAIFITERSVYTDKNVFAKMLYDNDKIEKVDYEIYLKWFEEFTQDLPLDGIIYIRTDPDVCNERIKVRNRPGETIPLEYSVRCHNYHEDWIHNTKCPVLTLNGNESNVHSVKEGWSNQIREFIHPNRYEKVPKMNTKLNELHSKAFC